MKRYYGIIKDIDSANAFVNDLYDAGSINPVNPIKILSSYSDEHLTGLTQAVDYLYNIGFVNTGLSSDAFDLVLETATRTMYGIPTIAATAQLSNNLMIIANSGYDNCNPRPEVFPADQGLANIMIRHTVTKEVEGEQVSHTTTTYLRHTNDNGVASALAYEITQVKSGDILVKIAGCTPSAYEDEIDERAFVGLSINAYREESDQHIVSTYRNHSKEYFGASAHFGGFLLHKMKEPSGDWGITIFTNAGSPLFTWTPAGDAIDETATDGTNTWRVNLNANLNRTIGRDPEEGEEPIIKMAALAPIFSPATNFISATAKWMQQSPHDYSYFDKTGHILIKANNGDYKFFVDHGICLSDEVEGSTDGSTIPGVRPINYAVSDRPNIPDAMPYSTNMKSYFDSLAGLSSRGWMNFKDETGDNDMVFSGSPVILPDGGCRFINRASSALYGYFKAKFYGDMGTIGSGNSGDSTVIYFVARFPSRSAPCSGGTYDLPLLSISPYASSCVASGDNSNLYAISATNGESGYCRYPGTFVTSRRGDKGARYGLQQVHPMYKNYVAYALYNKPNTNSTLLTAAYFDGNGNIVYKTMEMTGYDQMAFGRSDGTPISDGNIVLGSVMVEGDASLTPPSGNGWKWVMPQDDVGTARVVNYNASSVPYPSDGGEVYIDVKFIAVGDMGTGDGKLGYKSNQASYINECLTYLCRRFECAVTEQTLPQSEWYITSTANKAEAWNAVWGNTSPKATYIDIAYGADVQGGNASCHIYRVSVDAGTTITLTRSTRYPDYYEVTANGASLTGAIRYRYNGSSWNQETYSIISKNAGQTITDNVYAPAYAIVAGDASYVING